METLPCEVLTKVLSYLPPSDRLNSALTCTKWAQVVAAPELLEDILLSLRGPRLEAIETLVIENDRHYKNVRFSKAELFSFNSEFWKRLGRDLRKLEFDQCQWSPQVFNEILRECTRLQSLRISTYDDEFGDDTPGVLLSMEDFELPEDMCIEEIQKSLSDVHHLDLNFDVTGDILAHLLELMPNVATISVSRFDEDSDFVSRLPDLLGTKRRITRLILYTAPLDEDCEALIKLASADLRVLAFNVSGALAAYELVARCTNLRHFRLCGDGIPDDSQLKTIILKNAELEILELRGWGDLTYEGLAPIHRLGKLRKLSLHSCDVPYKFLSSLGKMSQLQHIDLDDSGRPLDAEALRRIASLPNLHTLEVNCIDLQPACLDVLFENFKFLRALVLGRCDTLTESHVEKLRQFKQLEHLKIRSGRRFTDLALEGGLGSSAMKSLVMYDCPITDSSLDSIAAHHGRLKTFKIDGCWIVTDGGLLNLLRREPLLEELAIADLPAVNGILRALENLCPRLRTLWIFQHYPQDPIEPSDPAIKLFRQARPAVDCILDLPMDW